MGNPTFSNNTIGYSSYGYMPFGIPDFIAYLLLMLSFTLLPLAISWLIGVCLAFVTKGYQRGADILGLEK